VSANAALNYLFCHNNQLTNIDVTANYNLATFDCSYNQITSLNVSSNAALSYLNCSNNLLTGLNVAVNTALQTLYCGSNQLGTLDISVNTALNDLECNNDNLTGLNIKNGNNSSFQSFTAINNPNLSCIQVDNPSYSSSALYWSKDAGAIYSSNCASAIMEPANRQIGLKIYPNPSSGIFLINLLSYSEATVILIHDGLGNILYRNFYNGVRNRPIDLSNHPKGLYFVEVLAGRERTITKVAIQ
jgi:hypothetical protein